MREFRVIILSSKRPMKIVRIVERIRRELPEVTDLAILYERRPGKSMWRRIRGVLGRLWEPHYLSYGFDRAGRLLATPFVRAWDGFLRTLHACPREPNAPPIETIDDLKEFAKKKGIAFRFTTDVHADASLTFIRDFRPDLGLVFGTRILKPTLFEIPRLGCINLHKRKLPDYRGGGPIGLWELLDGKKEMGVTVHEVTTDLDGGPILNETSIPIDPYDRLDSLALKADVVGDDLLILTIRDLASGTAKSKKQTSEGRLYRNPSDHLMHAYRRELEKKLPPIKVQRSRPFWKLALRTVALMPFLVLRNWTYRSRKTFPVIILYHHLITDRPHHLGLPTVEFERQIKYLRKHYHIASLPEAMRMLEEGSVAQPTVVLTFDDGYAENYINLRAITEEYRIPVFFFVSTAHISEQTPFQHDLRRAQENFPPLSWEQILKLRGAGFLFGSHTRTHFDCGSTDENSLKDEIVNSRGELEDRMGEPIDYFSFPWGMPANMSDPAKKLALQTYSYSYDAAGGINIPGKSMRQILRRSDHPGSLWDLELLLQNALNISHPADVAPDLLGAPQRG